MSQTIERYVLKTIYGASDYLEMISELSKKIDSDWLILQRHNSKDNVISFKCNMYLLNWLKFNYYNFISLTSHIDEEDIRNGWFVWLKDYRFKLAKNFDSVDERNTEFYDKYFDRIINLNGVNDYLDESIWCYKNGKYHACACLLFSSIENIERRIKSFNPASMFKMSNQLKTIASNDVICFNKAYFEDFEKRMNNFLNEHYYAKSLEIDPEPVCMNRNRVMHGIFTRRISKTDCLKLFVITNSLVRFNSWLDSFRTMKQISLELSKTEL